MHYFIFPGADTTLYSASGSKNTGLDEIIEVRKDMKTDGKGGFGIKDTKGKVIDFVDKERAKEILDFAAKKGYKISFHFIINTNVYCKVKDLLKIAFAFNCDLKAFLDALIVLLYNVSILPILFCNFFIASNNSSG